MAQFGKFICRLGFVAGVTAAFQAQGIDMQYLQGQMPTAPKAITPYGDDLFGDKVSLFDGSLNFEHTDLSLKGNNDLPVALIRGVSPGKHESISGYNFQLGDWAWKVPRIGGTFATVRGWQGSNGTAARCSYYWAPALEYVYAGGAGAAAVAPGTTAGSSPHGSPGATTTHGAKTPITTAVTQIDVPPQNFWHGTHIEVPGAGSQELLIRDPAYTSAPSSGGPYPLVTKEQWQVGCLASIQNGAGEGFYAISTNGVRYDFDWLAVRDSDQMKFGTTYLARQDVYLNASKVTDRFGNWVKYTYDPSNPNLLQKIESNDGRVITVTNSGGHATSATDGTRTITYGYSGSALASVTLPDGRAWTLSIATLYPPALNVTRPADSCDDGTTPPDGPQSFTGYMVHPSGATGTFTTSYVALENAGVPGTCQIVNGTGRYEYPPASVNLALSSKQITGPGLSTLTWQYAYGDFFNVADGSGYRFSTVTAPDGVVNRHRFGNAWHVNAGLLLEDQLGWDGSAAMQSVSRTYRQAAGQAFPQQFGTSLIADYGDWFSARLAPVDQVTTTQQSTSFSFVVNQFDAQARPVTVTRSGTGGSRSETTAYYDLGWPWVRGQVQSVSSGSAVMQSNGFNSLGQINSHSEFGALRYTRIFNPDGTLASETDPLNHTTSLSSYMRGLPQRVDFPTGAFETAIVNNLGLFTSYTNAAGYTTGYGYDPMGRLASITPPAGWTGTSLVFAPVNAAEYGLAAGHWKLTTTQGTAVTASYFDALWRPVMTRTYDSANEAATRKVVVKAYDPHGKPTFESYPQRDIGTVAITSPGKRMQYDALGRSTRTDADSELGVLTTTTEYLPGFQTRITNPRANVTVQTHWALDKPAEALLAGYTAPESVSVSISRDSFGKPLSITRGGAGASLTRSYVYNANQRLCKTLEPELIATVQDYDAAGNVAWRAPGVNLPAAGDCSLSSVAAASKISYGYNALNMLTGVSYGDGSPSITRDYWPDGKLKTVSTSDGSSWSYVYNSLRLLTNETLTYGGQSYGLTWGYSALGYLSSLTYPNSSSVNFNPNALGEAQTVSGYASAVSFHPNGAVAGYTLANNIAHSLTQNARGLPLVNRDAGVMQDQYAYDANGNVTGITDQQENIFTRSMGYDGLDRLKSANATGVWGSATYGYDTLDNLRAAVVGSRATSLSFNASNQLASVNTNGSVTAYGFDARGNLSSKGLQTFGFDLGNRLKTSSLGGSYAYDGLGRRIKIASSDGSTRIQVYGQQGQLLWATSNGGPRPSSTTAYVYLGGKQIAETSAGVTQYVHTDALGSPVAHTSSAGALINRARFEPYGYVAAGTKPSASTSVIGFTGHVQDAETDLVYMQQRYYDPIAGRFLSVDPVVTEANSGKGFGLYAYVDNNPYAKVDPDGRCEKPTGSNICARAPIHGNAQSSVNTPTHASTSERIAQADAAKPNVKSVHLNQSLRTITGDSQAPNIRPDVAAVYKSGRLDMKEVRSTGQTTGELELKMNEARARLGVPGRNIVVEPDPVSPGRLGTARMSVLGPLGVGLMLFHMWVDDQEQKAMTEKYKNSCRADDPTCA